MPKIIQLEEELINKIAAGEVIERPMSVVKELVENSIDANSTEIFIEIKEGGKSFIKVADNGEGMEKDDALLSIKRHTTSKIKNADDLFNIKTLGFRGEALSSIAAVSRISVLTKTKNSFEGLIIEAEAGNILKQKTTAAKNGTVISVNDLFYNVPARKKHLKNIEIEFNHILDLITRYALAYPTIYFKLIHNDKIVLNSPATTNTLSNIVSVYGREIAKNMLPVNYADANVEIMGYISKPSLTRADRQMQSLFINGRYVKNELIRKGIYEGYNTLLFNNRHPVVILNVAINPNNIDVNVHPTKSEIRIAKEDIIFNSVKNAVLKTLSSSSLVPEIEQKAKEKDTMLDFKDYNIIKHEQSLLEKPKKERESRLRICGRIHDTYIVAEDKDGMSLIDQHAAHERVLYEKFMKQYKSNAVSTQALLEPIVLELVPNDFNIVQQNKIVLKKLGFEIEDFGSSSIIVRTMPAIFGNMQEKGLIMELISELYSTKAEKIDNIAEEKIIRFACRSAVKAHDKLEMQEIHQLIIDLTNTETPYTCPHGRPTIIHYSLSELEKRFNRRV